MSDLLDADAGEPQLMDTLCAVKEAVNKALEAQRADGVIGASLEAEVTIYAADEVAQQLKVIEDEIRFVLIASSVTVCSAADAPADALTTEMAGVSVLIRKSEHNKCVRCWHYLPEVGSIAAHPELCQRCVDNVDGDGEIRRYA